MIYAQIPLTAERRFSASACLMLILSWLISTCWSSSFLNLRGGCFLMRLGSRSPSSSPGTVKASAFSLTREAELAAEVSTVLSLPLLGPRSCTAPGRSVWSGGLSSEKEKYLSNIQSST